MLPKRGTAAHPRPDSTKRTSLLAGRVAYVHSLTGPALAVDTACSSGLVAVAQAHSALLLGQCAAALAAAVNLILSPFTHASFAVAGTSGHAALCQADLALLYL